MTRILTSCVALTIAISSIAAPLNAADLSFKYKRSELQSNVGTEQLYARLSDRADRLCFGTDNRFVAMKAANKACAADFTDDVVVKIDHQRLYAVHERHLNGSVEIAAAIQ